MSGVRHRPWLLSDNGPSYLSAQLGSLPAEHGMTHTRGKPHHPCGFTPLTSRRGYRLSVDQDALSLRRQVQ